MSDIDPVTRIGCVACPRIVDLINVHYVFLNVCGVCVYNVVVDC